MNQSVDSTPFSKKIFERDRWKRYLTVKKKEFLLFPRLQQARYQGWSVRSEKVHLYDQLNEPEVLQKKSSDTLFVFGSGYSLNDISSEEWRAIEKNDTLGFNWFNNQTFVRCDFYIIREILTFVYEALKEELRTKKLHEYSALFNKPQFKGTVFLIQKGWRAYSANHFIGRGFLSPGSKIFFYKSITQKRKCGPKPRLSEGLIHGSTTLFDCVNFGYVMGYKKIVLVGVDLYDQRYFWLPADKTRPEHKEFNLTAQDQYPGTRWALDHFRFLKPFYDQKGISIEIYNPKSLLNKIFPIFNKESLIHRGGEKIL